MTSLGYIFTMEKALVKIIFIHDFFFIYEHFWVQKRMIRSHFAVGVSEQGDMHKGSFQRMV